MTEAINEIKLKYPQALLLVEYMAFVIDMINRAQEADIPLSGYDARRTQNDDYDTDTNSVFMSVPGAREVEWNLSNTA